MDLEKAFDRVLREVIRCAMHKLGVEERLVSAVMFMYTGAKTVVRTVCGNSSCSEAKLASITIAGIMLSIESIVILWSPYVIGRPYIFSSCNFYLLFFSSPNLSGRRLDVYHTSTHGVALVMVALCNRADHYIFAL